MKKLTTFEQALHEICEGWIGEQPGWEEYIKSNAKALVKLACKQLKEKV